MLSSFTSEIWSTSALAAMPAKARGRHLGDLGEDSGPTLFCFVPAGRLVTVDARIGSAQIALSGEDTAQLVAAGD